MVVHSGAALHDTLLYISKQRLVMGVVRVASLEILMGQILQFKQRLPGTTLGMLRAKMRHHLPAMLRIGALDCFSQSSYSCCTSCNSFCRCRSWVSYASKAYQTLAIAKGQVLGRSHLLRYLYGLFVQYGVFIPRRWSQLLHLRLQFLSSFPDP
jgi:hypothetical protein